MSTPNLVFGQFLLEFGKLTPEILHKALAIQVKEYNARLRTSPRLLGQILLEDFQVFKNRVELERCLVKFKEYNSYVENLYGELKFIAKRK